jgi:DNA-binding NarL/FixJ family response regulator
MYDEAIYAERCLRAGAEGYIQKQDELEKILEGVRSVLEGRLHVSQELSSRILRRVVDRKSESAGSTIASLSNRELQLLELIGRGMTTQQIADHLGLSTKTVHAYREHLKNKLGLDNTYQLVRYAVTWILRQ